jgi:hypothetical protein
VSRVREALRGASRNPLYPTDHHCLLLGGRGGRRGRRGCRALLTRLSRLPPLSRPETRAAVPTACSAPPPAATPPCPGRRPMGAPADWPQWPAGARGTRLLHVRVGTRVDALVEALFGEGSEVTVRGEGCG